MFENLKMALGYYKPNKEFLIPLNKIHITEEFLTHKVGERKMKRKLGYFRDTGKFQSKVVLNEDFELIDGYSTYCLIKEIGLGKVPVWFKM